jgi:hypothetical protein
VAAVPAPFEVVLGAHGRGFNQPFSRIIKLSLPPNPALM